MKDVMVLINSNEFQHELLNLINSEELDKFIDNSLYKDNKDAKGAIMFGLSLAGMLTCRCRQYAVPTDEIEKI